jgi:hypothetical protein
MGQLIDRLWETDFEFFNNDDESTAESLKLYNDARERLEASLSEEQNQLLHELLTTVAEYSATMERKAFSNGFSLGLRMSSEAFSETQQLLK